MTTVSYVTGLQTSSARGGTGNNAQWAPTLFAGVQVGDIQIIWVSVSQAESWQRVPTGWTNFFSGASSEGTGYSTRGYYRVYAGETEVDWQGGGFEWFEGVVLTATQALYREAIWGGATTHQSDADTASFTLPSIYAAKNGSVHLLVTSGYNAAPSTTPPSGFTLRQGPGGTWQHAVADRQVPSSGTQTSRTWSATTTVRNQGNASILLEPTNQPPTAPTSLAPDGKTIDRASTNRFSWTFSDPDDGDSQSKYDLRYRAVGAASWTVVSGTTTNRHHDFPGGTFTLGDFEWQVRTYDSLGEVGPYSSSAFFTAGDKPAGPSITDPVNGQTIATEDYTVVWSTPDQEAYELRRVADLAGAPDTATVLWTSGTVESTGARSRTVNFPTNNQNEHVQLRVRFNGLWSTWASVAVSVSYTVPATPTVAVDVTSVAGAIAVQATHPTPTGSQPTVTAVDVYRRVTSDGGDGIRIRADAPPTAVTVDYAVNSKVDFGYRVRAYGDNGTSSWSAWSEAATELAVYYGGGYS